jgi:2-polyprenyl-3-methyl-5-hydroxy-6-metoxy-1,4-benzoquinol methylase
MKESVRELFDSRALRFDSIYSRESKVASWINWHVRRGIYDRFDIAIRESGDVQGKRVLDVGCGSGRYMIEYAHRGAQKVVGLDFSPQMLSLARALAAQEGVQERCEFLEADFRRSEFQERFDVVLAMGVFDYLEKPVEFLLRMIALSRGKVIGSFPGKNPLRMRLRKFRYALRHCPVFFYTERDMHQLAHSAGLTRYQLVFIPYSGTGYVLVGEVGDQA